MQLNPQENFAIVRQLEDNDSNTYYVRAVVRNAITDALIETVPLTDRGSQRFSKNWLVPADYSGMGFFVSILTSVYTDSEFTTKSENYGDKIETYLVHRRFNSVTDGGAGGGDVDYSRIRKIINEVVAERLKKDIEMPKIPEIITVTKEVASPVTVKAPNVHVEAPNLAPLLSEIKNFSVLLKEREKLSFAEMQEYADKMMKDAKAILEAKDSESFKELCQAFKEASQSLTAKIDEWIARDEEKNKPVDDSVKSPYDERVMNFLPTSPDKQNPRVKKFL